MSAELEALIEELDLDLDLDELDDVEELDLAEKGLESVPACIFTLTTATTLALESESRVLPFFIPLFRLCSLSAHHSSARVSMPCVSDAARARGEGGWHSMPLLSSIARLVHDCARAWRGTLPARMDALSVSAPESCLACLPPPHAHAHRP